VYLFWAADKTLDIYLVCAWVCYLMSYFSETEIIYYHMHYNLSHLIIFRLATGLGWELSFHQDLVSFWFQSQLDVKSEAFISQRFDLISFHEKIFHLISQEEALILILSHLISWKTDFISWRCDLILILSHFISWKISLISLKCDFILISFHLISQKHDLISVLAWNQNETRYFSPSLVIQIIWCRKSREYY